MSPTVDDLRNEIRLAVGRYERVESTGFTKESLAAIAEVVGVEIDQDRFPPTGEMRAEIRRRVDGIEADDPEASSGSFRKSELVAIAEAVGVE